MTEQVSEISELLRARGLRGEYLEELKRHYNCVQGAITKGESLDSALEAYEKTFHESVNAHEVCLANESDEEKRTILVQNYEYQRDLKIELSKYVAELRYERQVNTPPRSIRSHCSKAKPVLKKKGEH